MSCPSAGCLSCSTDSQESSSSSTREPSVLNLGSSSTPVLLPLPAKHWPRAAGFISWNFPSFGHPLDVLHWDHTLFSAQGCSVPLFSKVCLQVTQALLWAVVGLTLRQDASKKPKKYYLDMQPCNCFGVYPPAKLNVPGLSRHREQIWLTRRNITRAVLATLERPFHSFTRLPQLFSTGQDILSDYSSTRLNLYSWLFLNGTYFCMARREIKEENYPIMFLSIWLIASTCIILLQIILTGNLAGCTDNTATVSTGSKKLEGKKSSITTPRNYYFFSSSISDDFFALHYWRRHAKQHKGQDPKFILWLCAFRLPSE